MGAGLVCASGSVVQNRRPTETSSAETAGRFRLDMGSVVAGGSSGIRVRAAPAPRTRAETGRFESSAYLAHLAQIHTREKASGRSVAAFGRRKGY